MCIQLTLRANSAGSIGALLVNSFVNVASSLPDIKSRPPTLRLATLLWLLDSSIRATCLEHSSKSTACHLLLTEERAGLEDKYKNAKTVQDFPWLALYIDCVKSLWLIMFC